MDTKKIIKQAWGLTQQHKKLVWWYAFLPELLGLIIGIYYLVYQYMSFLKSDVFRSYAGDSFAYEMFEFGFNFVKGNPSLGIFAIVSIALIVLLYLFLPIFCKASLVQLIARIKNGQTVKPIDGISFGFLHFLQLFEYRFAVRTFSVMGLLSYASFVIRNLGPDVFKLLIIPFGLGFIFAFAMLLLFTYSEYFIIIDGKGVIKSMAESVRLVVRHWQHTFLILILLFLITLRIVFNVLLVLLIPALIIISTAALAAIALAKVGMILGIVLAIGGLFFAAYLNGILEVFTSAVWTFTFLELTEKGEVSARETN